MFTGIVEEIGKITSIRPKKLTVLANKVLEGVELGASIAVNGVCLTVTDFTTQSFSAGVMPETLERTNLSILKTGDEVNLERALLLGGRLGGHFVQGHIDDTGKISNIRREKEAIVMRFNAPHRLMRYIAVKGFIAVNGLSLTVVEVGDDSFSVSLIDYTQRHTTIGKRKIGDIVNIEVDIVAKYVESLSKHSEGNITFDFLKEHGFVSS